MSAGQDEGARTGSPADTEHLSLPEPTEIGTADPDVAPADPDVAPAGPEPARADPDPAATPVAADTSADPTRVEITSMESTAGEPAAVPATTEPAVHDGPAPPAHVDTGWQPRPRGPRMATVVLGLALLATAVTVLLNLVTDVRVDAAAVGLGVMAVAGMLLFGSALVSAVRSR